MNTPGAEPRTVRALIEQQARERPDAIYALAADSEAVLRYGQLERDCRAVGELLSRHGVRRGDTVSIVMPNGLQTVRLLLGAMRAGCIVNPVNLLSQGDAMRHVLEHSDCRIVFVAPEWEERVRALLAGIERTTAVVVAGPDGDGFGVAVPDNADPSAPEPDDVALLMYTSGTTGLPKGVMLTQANLAANAHSISREHALGPADRVLAVLPLYHINAFAVTMLAPLAHGGSLVMPTKFSAARFWG